jgi:hypothetical protein
MPKTCYREILQKSGLQKRLRIHRFPAKITRVQLNGFCIFNRLGEVDIQDVNLLGIKRFKVNDRSIFLSPLEYGDAVLVEYEVEE